MYKITCPFCFKEFDDTDVKFRSEFVNGKELDEFNDQYERHEAELFSRGMSSTYKNWWGGDSFATSEKDPAATAAKDVQPYERPVIDPSSSTWQNYLLPIGNGDNYKSKFLIRDNDGMVAHIKLRHTALHEEITCSRRVCPRCHNPLPENFGKTPIITIPIIGVMGAGKTVYMSSLLSNISSYVTSVGYTGAVSTNGVYAFRQSNKVGIGNPLPNPTNPELVQQPLCFVMNKPLTGIKLASYTVVLYDLAGEYFNDDAEHNILIEEKHRRPLLEHADGIILLIDPGQLTGKDKKNPAVIALDKIQNVLLSGGSLGTKAETPIAICTPKADSPEFKAFFGSEIQELATQGVDYDKQAKKIPAEQYNKLNDGLREVMQINDDNGIYPQTYNYQMSRFFAFSAVNGELIEGGILTDRPFPKRIEDPLLWLLAKNGYCDVEGNLNYDIKCPNQNCGSYYTRYEEHQSPDPKRFLKSQTYSTFNHVCRRCHCIFNVDDDGRVVGEFRFLTSEGRRLKKRYKTCNVCGKSGKRFY